MITLGVDPGIANTGIAVVARSMGGYRLIGSKLIISTPELAKAERLYLIYSTVKQLLNSYGCSFVSIEKCYHNKNVSSSQSTAYVIGAVMCASAAMDVQVIEVTPQQVKGVTGLGPKCNKKMVVRVMSGLLKQPDLNNHVADAAACAIAGILLGS